MGGKSKKAAQKILVENNLVEVLHDMFSRLDWTARPPAQPHAGESSPHGAGCSCHPVTCLQIQMLRTLQVGGVMYLVCWREYGVTMMGNCGG